MTVSYKMKHAGGRKGHVIESGCIYIVCCYYWLEYKVIWSQAWKSNNVIYIHVGHSWYKTSNNHHTTIWSGIKIYIHIHCIVFIYICSKKITSSEARVSRVNQLNMSEYLSKNRYSNHSLTMEVTALSKSTRGAGDQDVVRKQKLWQLKLLLHLSKLK